MGAWQAWLNLLKRLREADEKRREQTQKDPDAWRRGKEYNDDMKNWKGQGLVEYALLVVLAAIVVIVALAIIGNILINPVNPPAKNAPLLEIVRYCEPRARDEHSSFNGKTTSTIYTDNPEKFIVCMQGYEYTVKR